MDLNAVETKITVAGKPCDFVYMNLDQYVTGHHTFEIAVNYRHHTQSVWAITPDDIFRETLGKPVGIQMTHIESGAVNEFSGLVTDIEALGVNGDPGTIILRGGSPTVLLDRNPMMDSFMDYTLSGVVAETIGKTAVPMGLQNRPKMDDIIPYIGRYDETTWAFLSRILAAYGEWFYYDGKKLIVGNPMSQDECRVTFDVELHEVRSAAGMRNVNNPNTPYFYHHAEDNKYYEEAPGTVGANFPMKGAKMASDPMYPTPHKRPTGREILGEGDMTNMVRTKYSRDYTKCSVFTARCNTCAVHIGGIATILLPKADDVMFTDLGSFRVLEIHHHAEQKNRYENTFSGIAAQTETLPDDHIVTPRAFAEPAIVIDNDDPKKKGRVKVRFAWQDAPYTTNWIQVQTPDAGSSSAVPKNRGFFFIPEIDDQVLVGFLHGDPSRPYVAGSLYHRDITMGAAPDNTIRTIISKKGSTICFDDGGHSISIFTAKGNIIKIDEESGTISMFSENLIEMTTKDVIINASNDMTISVGNNFSMSVGEDSSLTTHGNYNSLVNKNSTQRVQGKSTTLVSKDIAVESMKTIEVSSQELEVESAGKATIGSGGVMSVKSKRKVDIAKG